MRERRGDESGFGAVRLKDVGHAVVDPAVPDQFRSPGRAAAGENRRDAVRQSVRNGRTRRGERVEFGVGEQGRSGRRERRRPRRTARGPRDQHDFQPSQLRGKLGEHHFRPVGGVDRHHAAHLGEPAAQSRQQL